MIYFIFAQNSFLETIKNVIQNKCLKSTSHHPKVHKKPYETLGFRFWTNRTIYWFNFNHGVRTLIFFISFRFQHFIRVYSGRTVGVLRNLHVLPTDRLRIRHRWYFRTVYTWNFPAVSKTCQFFFFKFTTQVSILSESIFVTSLRKNVIKYYIAMIEMCRRFFFFQTIHFHTLWT